MIFRFARLLLVHMAGNAALALAAWYWLAVPDRSLGYILLSVLLAVAILFGFVWLQGSALAAFRPETEKAPFRSTLRRVHVAALGIVAVLAVPAVAIWLGGYAPKVTAWLSGLLTSMFRKPVSPRAVGWMYPALLWAIGVAWFIAGLAWTRGRAALRSRRYWTEAAALLAAGILLPYVLLAWVPGVNGLTAQAISLVVRFLLAYTVAVAAWLALARAAARPMPVSPEAVAQTSPAPGRQTATD